VPRPARVPKTLGELRDAWFEARQDQVDVCERSWRPPDAEDRLSQATVDDQRGVFRNHITPIWSDDTDYRKKELADIKALITDVREGATANPAARIQGGDGPAHTVSIILVLLFDWAKEQGARWLIHNPTVGLKIRRMIPSPPRRDRWLPTDELRAIWQSAAQEPYPAGPLCLLQLLLFQRPGELRNMEAEEIDEKEKLLTVRGWHDPEKEGEISKTKLTEAEVASLRKARKSRHRTKTRRDYVVPLAPLALEILGGFPRVGKYVFTYADDGSRPASKTMADSWKKRIHARAETILGRPITPWNFHDSRRTASTTMSEELDLPPDIAEFNLQHAAKLSGEAGERVTLSSSEVIYNHDKRLKKKWTGALAWENHLRNIIPTPMLPADFKTLRPAETRFRMLPWDRALAKRLFVEGAGKVSVKDIHRTEQLKGYTYGTLLCVIREITPTKAHTTTPEKREKAVALWDTGMPVKAIGRDLKMNTTVILNAVRALRPPGAQRVTLSAKRNAKLNALVDAGKMPGEISALLGVPEATVYRLTRARRLKLRDERK
jgi:integrase